MTKKDYIVNGVNILLARVYVPYQAKSTWNKICGWEWSAVFTCIHNAKPRDRFLFKSRKSRADLYQKMMMGISIANTKWGASVIEGAWLCYRFSCTVWLRVTILAAWSCNSTLSHSWDYFLIFCTDRELLYWILRSCFDV